MGCVKSPEFNKKDNEWTVEKHIKLLRSDVPDNDMDAGEHLKLPPWYDQDKFKRGQDCFDNYSFPMNVGKLAGTVALLTVPSIANVLEMTNNSSTGKTAFKRYLLTLAHMKLWYESPVHDKNSLAYKSLNFVLQRHKAANKRARATKIGSVSQSAIAFTQFGFLGYILLGEEKLGISFNSDDLQGIIHFWKTIGYMMGLQDKYNICRDDVAETKVLFKAINEEFFVPVFKNPTKQFNKMSKALLEGMHGISVTVESESFLALTKYLAGMEVKPCKSFTGRLIFEYMKFVLHFVVPIRIARKWLNFLLNWSISANLRWPIVPHLILGVPLESTNLFD